MKRCTKCGEVKPLDAFRAEPRVRSGVASRCKACCNAVSAAWKKAHPELTAQRKKAWREANPGSGRAADARWRLANLDRKIEQVKAWKRANPDAVRSSNAGRRQLSRRAVPWLDAAAVRRLYRTARWLRSLGLPLHIDHVVALKGKEACGLHVQNNLRLAFAKENLRKGARLPEDAHGPQRGQFVAFACPGLTGKLSQATIGAQ